MLHRSRLPVLALAVLVPLGLAAAQNPLRLDVVGGSLPGVLSFDLHPGAYPLEACFVLTGIDPGPTPIALFDPGDPRSVQVGTAFLSNSFFGLTGLDGHFRIGPNTIPALTNLVDGAFFFQGVTFPGTATLVDRISNPTAIRMGLAGAFRDRGVALADERSFAVVLPRADGRFMIAGGGRGGLLSQVAHATTEIYDEITDSFSYGPPMTTPRSLHVATLLPDGRWLLTGGVDGLNDPQAACEVYNPVTDAFTAVAPMLSPRMGHTATLLPDGRVLVAGGLDAITVTPSPIQAIFDTTNTTELYNPATNQWAPGPNLRTPRAGHAAILRPNGQVLLAGGISYDFVLPAVRNTTDMFSPATNSIAAGPSMASAHALTNPVPLGNDRWLVAGGVAGLTIAAHAVAEVYNAAANTWSGAGSMSVARGNQVAFALGGGRFLVAGGGGGSLLSPTAESIGEVYDAGTNGWSLGPALTIPRAGALAFPTLRGQVHVPGGVTTLGAGSTTCEWYYF